MINKISLLGGLLIFAASSSAANFTQFQATASSSPSKVAQVSDVQCQGKAPQQLAVILGDYRLAQQSDFVASIRKLKLDYNPKEKFTCSIFTADFNQDGLKDYAMLLVNKKTSNFRFQMALNKGKGKFNSAIVKDYKRITKPYEGVIYTSMSFKPAKSPGLALRDYSPLKQGTAERKQYEAKPAISLWKSPLQTKNGVPQNLDVSTLGYCSEAFYLVEGKQKTFVVCD
jgi:hypothetical protein